MLSWWELHYLGAKKSEVGSELKMTPFLVSFNQGQTVGEIAWFTVDKITSKGKRVFLTIQLY